MPRSKEPRSLQGREDVSKTATTKTASKPKKPAAKSATAPAQVGTKDLTAKQTAFAEHYALHKDASAAYRAAYDAADMAPDTIRSQASRLLRNPLVAARVAKLSERVTKIAEERFDITVDKILQELAAIAFANVQDYVTVDEETGIPMPDFRKVTRKQFAALTEVVFEDIETGQRTGKRVKFKLGPKKEALVDLGRHYGMFKDQGTINVNHTGTVTQKVESPADIAAAPTKAEALKKFDAFRTGLASRPPMTAATKPAGSA